MKNKFFLISISLLCASNVKAQDIKATEVRVTEQFVPSIPEATKLNEQATFFDTAKVDKTQEYSISQHSLKSNYKTRPLKAAKVKAESISKLFKSKVSLGTGFRVGTKATITHNSERAKTLNYGVLFNHFNNNVKIDDKLAGKSNNNLHLYAKKIKKDKIYIANLDYERVGVFTYGNGTTDKKNFDNSITKNNPFYNRFSYTKFSVSTISTDNDPNKMIRNATFFVADLNEMSENQIHLSADVSKEINGLPINLEIELNDYFNYNNKDCEYESTDVKSLHLSPSSSFTKFSMDFDITLELHYLSDNTPFEFFPQLKATKELVKDILLVYGGIRHSEQRHTLKSLSDENPYIHSFGTNQSIVGNNGFYQQLETTDSDELYVAMRNVLGKDEVFYGSIAYGEINNLAYFDNIIIDNYNRFNVEYRNVWQLHANARYDKRINNLVSLNINADYYNWNEEVSHKPNLTFDISAPINLREKIKITPFFEYKGQMVSYAFSNQSHPDDTIEEILSAQFHFNLGLQYNYSKILLAYLQLNNLNGSNKELWRDYQEIGFNGVFGLSYSF